MKSNRKRLSLLAGSSLVAASLLAVGGASLAPTAALAAEECGSPPSGTKTCSGTHAAIDYPVTTGNLTLNLANDLNVTTGGIAVNGTGSNSVTIGRSNTGAATLDPVVTSTSDAGIAVNNVTGAITVNLTDPAFATGPGIAVTGTTHGVHLQTGATTSSAMNFTMTNGTVSATGATGIGLSTETTNTTGGNTTLNIGGTISGETGVSATNAGTGSMTINLTAASGSVAGGQVLAQGGPALDLSPNRNLSISLGADTLLAADGGANAVVEVAASNTPMTLTNLGTLRSNDTTAAGHDDLVLRVGGGAGTVTMTHGRNFQAAFPPFLPEQPALGADLRGRIHLANTGTTNFNLLGTTVWHTAGTSLLGEGTTNLSHGVEAVISASANGANTDLDFGGGGNTYSQVGVLAVGAGTEAASTLSLSNLGLWELSGTVLFGSNGGYTASDGVANDLIVAQGAGLLGLPGARLMMDVDLSGSQSSCETPTAADCLVLTGGNVNGVTSILVNDVSGGVDVLNTAPLLLVDVNGGLSHADRFVLDPSNEGYVDDATLGGVLDGGLYFYGLSYDEATQRHYILGMPKRETLQLSTLGAVAQTTWRAMTMGRTERGPLGVGLQEPEVGSGAGAWLKIVGRTAARELDQSQPLFTYTAETGYDQETTGLVGGVDLITSPGRGQTFVAGVTAGYARSDLTFKNSLTEASLKGPTLGVYGAFGAGAFFLDAIVNAAWLDTEFDAPGIGFTGEDAAEGELRSVGAQVEAGYRLPINDGEAYFEPLAALAYVTTDVEDFTFGDIGDLEADEVTSLRGSLGGRIGGELAFETYSLKMSLTARHWQEFEGENQMTVTSNGTDVLLLDDVTGAFNEVNLDFGLYSGGAFQNLSIQLGAGIRFADDYKDAGGSLGFRYQW